MFFRAILLICVGFSIASPVGTHLDELKELMSRIDTHIRSETNNAAFVLRSLNIALSYYANDAHRTYINELTEAAQPYWTFIAVAEREAAERGQNIVFCVERGHNEIYALNNTYANAAYENVYAELAIGQKLIDNTYGPARDEPNDKLQEMHARVNACNNEACAVQLQDELSREYSDISASIAASLDKTEHYVYVEFHENIEEHIFNPARYTEDMNRIIGDVEHCIRTN
ncbi:uncharacterized protein LOC143205331 [Rhynchophorus ferrugineus]|uniref:uncharacterized protein LOC143205331 n=1 Tax=Rhynchophorus ferrugineus TaxID=354439 RepID=UPI003FCCFE7C